MSKTKPREPDPGTWLLNKIDIREQGLTCQIEQTQAQIDALTTRLRELQVSQGILVETEPGLFAQPHP
ncbi:hypothetical protein [Microtetraspora malaysiensis]|uniref:hypothetical protein n=1 Tax=Microtetraspora malaysiensis TaxID=161358 RepID=UPI000834E9D6|nr:hypothetical protein [Microtetraspora malaysiensis]